MKALWKLRQLALVMRIYADERGDFVKVHAFSAVIASIDRQLKAEADSKSSVWQKQFETVKFIP